MLSCLFFKQKTSYEVRISDWSSDVCSSDLGFGRGGTGRPLGCLARPVEQLHYHNEERRHEEDREDGGRNHAAEHAGADGVLAGRAGAGRNRQRQHAEAERERGRSEEHTSELQSLMRISYAVFCLKKKTT